MDFWKDECIQKVRDWIPGSKPLFLIGPIGCGKSTTAMKLLEESYEVVVYYPSDIHNQQFFLESLDAIIFQESILALMKVGKQKAVIIESVETITSAEKLILRRLSTLRNTKSPVIFTSRKLEKRHREIARNSHRVDIEMDSLKLEKRNPDLRCETVDDTMPSEEISVLGSQILNGSLTKVPISLNLTETSSILEMILENLFQTLPEELIILSDRTLARIFQEERWDLVRILNDCIYPNLMEWIKKHPVCNPTFRKSLSNISTRALNRKTLMSLKYSPLEDPIYLIKTYKEELPGRFRCKEFI
jgi:AAA+ ATPase superfamily predicted ATPase